MGIVVLLVVGALAFKGGGGGSSGQSSTSHVAAPPSVDRHPPGSHNLFDDLTSWEKSADNVVKAGEDLGHDAEDLYKQAKDFVDGL